MPPVTRKSILGSHYGQGTDVAKIIAQDNSLPSTGFQDPPPGLRFAKAQLEEVKFENYKSGKNEGKPYMAAMAVIREPYDHTYTPTSKGVPTGDPITVVVEGKTTRITVDIFDKKNESGSGGAMGKVTTWQEGAQKAAQILRSLGGDTRSIGTVDQLEDVAATLTRVCRNPQTPIYISFSTSVRKAQNVGDADGVWQNWHGTQGLEDYSPPENSAGVSDQSGVVDQSYVDDSDPQKALAEVQSGDDTPSDQSVDDISTEPLNILLAAAQNDDGPAQNELLRRASEISGKTTDEIEAIDEITWEKVVAMIEGKGSVQDVPTEPEPPKKDDHFNYRPMVKAIGGKLKKASKPIECVVTTVNMNKKTVTLKNVTDGKTPYKDVPFDELEEIT